MNDDKCCHMGLTWVVYPTGEGGGGDAAASYLRPASRARTMTNLVTWVSRGWCITLERVAEVMRLLAIYNDRLTEREQRRWHMGLTWGHMGIT
jgi:hypothetical protein